MLFCRNTPTRKLRRHKQGDLTEHHLRQAQIPSPLLTMFVVNSQASRHARRDALNLVLKNLCGLCALCGLPKKTPPAGRVYGVSERGDLNSRPSRHSCRDALTSDYSQEYKKTLAKQGFSGCRNGEI